jgi:tetratricopeptide (TPR) repeat protein
MKAANVAIALAVGMCLATLAVACWGPSEAEKHFVRGMDLRSEGRSEEAIDEFNKGIQADPDFDSNYTALGLVYVDLAEYERAIDYLDTAIELDPDDKASYNSRGGAYYYLENYEKAMDDLEKALELDPTYSWAYYNRGSVYAELGDDDQAIADYEKALSLATDPVLIAEINLAIELLKTH